MHLSTHVIYFLADITTLNLKALRFDEMNEVCCNTALIVEVTKRINVRAIYHF